MSRRRLFGSLCAMVFLVNFARVVYAPLLEPLKVAFGAGDAEVGLLATLAWAGSAAPRIPTGYLLTRLSRRYVVLASGFVLAGASALAAVAPTMEALWVGAFCMGLSSGVYFIAANPLVSELFPDRVGRAIGIHGTANQLAAVAAPLLVGVVLALGSWQLTFLASSVAALLTAVALVVAARGADLPEAGIEDRDFLGAARRQWRLILTGVVIVGATALVWNGLFNFYVTYLTAEKALEPDTARIVLTLVFAAGVPAFFFTGRLADRVPAVPLLLTIVGAFVAGVFALTALSGLFALVAVSLAIGYVAHALFPVIDTFLLAALPDENRASAYAVYSGVIMLVQAAGSSVVGTLADSGVPFAVIFRSAAFGLAALLCVLVGLYFADRLPTDAISPSTARVDD